MNQAFEIAGIGLSSQQRALDAVADNISNVNTPGFKRVDVRFVELLSTASDSEVPTADGLSQLNLGGVNAFIASDLNLAGDIKRTGEETDVAIDGAGFIELLGPNGQTFLWRGGQLDIRDGLLATTGGMLLRGLISAPPTGASLIIDADGRVSARMPSDDSLTELGQISLVSVEDPRSLERLDGGLYRVTDGARMDDVIPGEAGGGYLVQGGIEQSNVRINDEMIQLMLVQRAYSANAQVVQAADQLAGIANNLKE